MGLIVLRLFGDRALYSLYSFDHSLPEFVSRSTRNTRIERLWGETAAQFVRRWRAFFARLESLHGLKPECAEHLWLLHTLFLDAINDDCRKFQQDWNAHPISGRDTKNKSPNVCSFDADESSLTSFDIAGSAIPRSTPVRDIPEK